MFSSVFTPQKALSKQQRINPESYDEDNMFIDSSPYKGFCKDNDITFSTDSQFHKPGSFQEEKDFIGFIYDIPKKPEIFSN